MLSSNETWLQGKIYVIQTSWSALTASKINVFSVFNSLSLSHAALQLALVTSLIFIRYIFFSSGSMSKVCTKKDTSCDASLKSQLKYWDPQTNFSGSFCGSLSILGSWVCMSIQGFNFKFQVLIIQFRLA